MRVATRCDALAYILVIMKCAKKTTVRLTSALLIISLSSNLSGQVLFDCQTKKSERLRLNDDGTWIDFHYSIPSQSSKLIFKVIKSKAKTHQWDGLGSWRDYQVVISDKNSQNYVFYVGWNSQSKDVSVQSGLEVYRKDQLLAHYECDTKQPFTAEFVDINLEPL